MGPHATFQASSSTSHFIHIGLCTFFEHTMSLCLHSFAQSIPLSNTSYTSTPCLEKKKPNHITKANLIITSFVKTSLAPHHHRGVSQPLICASQYFCPFLKLICNYWLPYEPSPSPGAAGCPCDSLIFVLLVSIKVSTSVNIS